MSRLFVCLFLQLFTYCQAFAADFLIIEFRNLKANFSPSDVRNAKSSIEPSSKIPHFEFEISTRASESLFDLTSKAVGDHVNISLCGKLIAYRAFVAEPITQQGMQLTTGSIDEAERYARIINSGDCD